MCGRWLLRRSGFNRELGLTPSAESAIQQRQIEADARRQQEEADAEARRLAKAAEDAEVDEANQVDWDQVMGEISDKFRRSADDMNASAREDARRMEQARRSDEAYRAQQQRSAQLQAQQQALQQRQEELRRQQASAASQLLPKLAPSASTPR